MASNMQPEEMKALVRQRFEALDHGNFKVLDEIFLPTYQLNVPGLSGPLSLDATRRLYQMMYGGFPNLAHNIIEQVAADDKVVTRWVATGTHTGNFMGVAPTSKPVQFAGINIYTIQNRKFAQSQVNWDLLSLFRQIGAATVNAKLSVEG
jgi:predicted ester cyclase